MSEVLKYRAPIYGLMAIWIMLFHIHGHGGVGMPHVLGFLSPIIARGNMGVDVFLFLSGYCLVSSYEKSTLGQFYKKRIIRLLLPYVIIATPFYIWKSCVTDSNFIFDLSGISYWLDGMQWTWFVNAILLCYALFPFFYKIVVGGGKNTCALILGIYTVLIVAYFLCGSRYVAAGNAYLRLPVFLWGIVAKVYDVKFNKVQLIVLAILGGASVAILHKFGLDFFIRLSLSLFVVPLIYVLAFVFSKVKTVFLSYSGSISLELYLAHILTINLFAFYGYMEIIGYYSYIVIPVIAYILSIISKRITDLYESSCCRRV